MKRLLLLLSGLAVATLVGIALLGPSPAQTPGVNSPWPLMWSIPLDSIKRTYGYGLTSLSPAQLATDIFQICGGTSQNGTKVTRISVSGRATAVTSGDVVLVKRSTQSIGANTFQISGTAAGTPFDASDAAGTATLWAWTSNPTVGTVVGIVASQQLVLSNLTTGAGSLPVIFEAGRPAKAVTLRNANQCLAVSLTGQSFAGNLFDISVEWTEE